jgi:predicted cobalt transporter CbtA
MGGAMNTGLLATIAIFVLAAIFGIILWLDAKKTTKSEKLTAARVTTTTAPPATAVKPQRDSWKESAERFKRFASKANLQTEG